MTHVALLGGAHIHTPGFIAAMQKRAGEVKVAGVWDHEMARAEKRGAELGAAVFKDVPGLLRAAGVTAVVICAETHLHESLVLAAAKAKKDIFVEKPLGMTAAQSYAMADAVERAGVLFQTGYFMRGDPKYLFFKQHVAQGSFGRITRVRAANCHSGALGGWFDTEWRWMADPVRAGFGAFGDLGTHSLDILLWLFGQVTAATALLDGGTKRYPECDEAGEALMRFANGTIGTLAAAWADLANPISMQISGTEGHGAIVNGQVHFHSRIAGQFDGSSPVRQAELPPPQTAGFELFLDAITGKHAPNLVGVREAAYRVAVMEAMYEGAKSGTWVTPV